MTVASVAVGVALGEKIFECRGAGAAGTGGRARPLLALALGMRNLHVRLRARASHLLASTACCTDSDSV